jgi:lipoate-protein ligase A
VDSWKGGWTLRRDSGPAEALHAASADTLNDTSVERILRLLSASSPALVLGSHQDETVFDPAALSAAGVGLARRRSGGSAVLVGPGRVVWADFVIGAGDPLWDDDVGRAAWWVGELWASVLGPGADVWRRPMRRNAWSPVVCFAGLAPGEVTLSGRKVVGVSQRRTPRAVLFQTAALVEWRADEYGSLLRSLPAPLADLERAAAGAGPSLDLEASLLERMLT